MDRIREKNAWKEYIILNDEYVEKFTSSFKDKWISFIYTSFIVLSDLKRVL